VTATLAPGVVVAGPGVYGPEVLSERAYHEDRSLAPELGRSLSQSGAKTLLRSPARFAYERDHGRPPKAAFDLGSTVHALALRDPDSRIRVADCTDWKTAKWQAYRDEAYADGLIPVTRTQLRQASLVARAVRRHPLAARVLSQGRPGVSAYAVDPETGVTLRCRIDHLHPAAIVDLKTTAYGRGTPDAFGRSAAEYDYPLQAAFYQYVWRLATGELLPFVTITVETEPPYFVTVGQYDPEDMATGYARMRQAIDLYSELESSGNYDPPATDIVTFELPPWYGRR
jgi:hypothetical protein